MNPEAQTGHDQRWMRQALALAGRAQREDDEIPVGALVVDADGRLVAEGWNRNIAERDPSAHAEIVAAGSVFDLLADPRHNHQVEVVGGVLGEEAGALLTGYFRAKRGKPVDPG